MNALFGRLLCSLLMIGAVAANAQPVGNFPTKPVKMLVGFPPGNTTDIIARILAEELGKSLGQPFVIENRPGATGTLAVDVATKSPPDGYTLVMASSGSIAIAPGLFKKLPYDAVKDFAPISLTAQVPLVLVTNPALGIQTVSDLLKYSSAQKTFYGSSGNGTTQHLASEMFKAAANLSTPHVPYKGSAQTLTDVMGGAVHWAMDSTASTLTLIKGGKLKALAVTTLNRIPTLPDVPTLAELGYQGFEATAWIVLGAPNGTPEAIINRLSSEVARISALPRIQELYARLGVVPPFSSTPEQTATYIKSEISKWSRIIKQSGASVD